MRDLFSENKIINISGTVKSIIFSNIDNGYTVFELFDVLSKSDVVCFGNLPVISVGEELELKGEFKDNPKYGEQFAVKECRIGTPKTREGIIKYLSSGLIKGIGEATARLIVGSFGADTLAIMENDPERLAEVKGISRKKAVKISERVSEVREMQDYIMYLQGYSLSLGLAMKIYAAYGAETKSILEKNPYKLIDDIEGVGFLTSDKIAQNMGIAFDSEFRLRAGVIYTLIENADKQGNTYLFMPQLIEQTVNLLKIDRSVFEEKLPEIIGGLIMDLTVKRVLENDVEGIALSKHYNTEKSIAARLIKLKEGVKKIDIDEGAIQDFAKKSNIKFHPSQLHAISSALNDGVAVITGGPGTGKTTIVKCICSVLKKYGLNIECCAPTGRAAKRMGEATGEDAKTIHRSLEISSKKGLYFTRNENNPLDADVIIVDEMSMADIFIFNALVKAVKFGGRLIMLGDKDQLPSVSAGNVLHDIIQSGLMPVAFLTHIYRQSADSLIVSNAHRINTCEMPVINNRSKDFFFMNTASPAETAETVVKLVEERLPKFLGVVPSEIQVLSPMKAGEAGIISLNGLLQETLNPPSKTKGEIVSGSIKFRLGDKVMQTQNDYQMEWERVIEKGKVLEGEGVFNGDMGYITAVHPGSSVEITFDDGRVAEYALAEIKSLVLAYAITIHKSQGSEFPVAVIPLTSGPPTILNKNLLYTAVTRAKSMVVIVGSNKNLYAMVKNNYIVKRNTLLRRFLVEEEEKFKSFYNEHS